VQADIIAEATITYKGLPPRVEGFAEPFRHKTAPPQGVDRSIRQAQLLPKKERRIPPHSEKQGTSCGGVW
jgi:hypothetical protein